MVADNAFYRLFLSELDALSSFTARRSDEGRLRLGSEDPDARRIVEAMAFFTARTRAAAVSEMQDAVARMAGGTFDELLAPMPAAALVQAVPADALPAPVTIPRGSTLRFQFADPAFAAGKHPSLPRLFHTAQRPAERVAIFSTLEPVVIRPLTVSSASITGARSTLTLAIRIRAGVPQRGPVDIDLHVRRMADYGASVALHHALEQQRGAVTAQFGDGTEAPCRVTFGAPPAASASDEGDARHPLAQIRSFFHFPEQALAIRVAVPAAASPWDVVTLRFALDATWPRDMAVSADAFRLFVIPAVNVWSDFAAPIVHDGTKDRHPIHCATTTRDAAEPIAIRGVYQADRGMAPLFPFVLAKERNGYEVARAMGGSAPLLRLRLPDAFTKPRQILVDAEWSQPSLWTAAPGTIAIAPQLQSWDGVRLELLGAVRRPEPSPLALDPARCLDVLSLKMRPVLDRSGLVGVLELLGAAGESPYRGFPDKVEALRVDDHPDPLRRSGGIKRVYDVFLARSTPDAAPLSFRFAEQIASLLRAWTQDAVDVRVAEAQADQVVR